MTLPALVHRSFKLIAAPVQSLVIITGGVPIINVEINYVGTYRNNVSKNMRTWKNTNI